MSKELIMKRTRTIALPLVVLVVVATAAGAAESYRSPETIVAGPSGNTLYIAEATANSVAVFDIAKGKVIKQIAVPEPPSGLALSADGAHLYVTGGAQPGHLHVVTLPKGKVTASIPAGHTPVAPVAGSGSTVYVCSRFDNDIAVVDVAANKVVKRIAVSREPIAAALTPDKKTLVVGNHLPSGASDGAYVATTIALIDVAAGKVVADIALPNGSTGVRGICLSPDGANAYATHILGRYQLPTTQLERGWMNTNALTVIDVAGGKLVNTVLLDDVDYGAANPWAVACTPDGSQVCVTLAGTHELSVIDRAALHDKLNRVAAGEQVTEVSRTPDDVPNDLAFLVGIRRRLKLAGNGPRGIAVADSRAYVTEFFTGGLGVVELAPDAVHRAKTLPLGPEEKMTVARKGEMFFNDASLCFQSWQSCASCHPDVRADALNWDLLNDGMGNPKNTKSLLLSHETPPVMISGVRDQAETAVRAGIRFIQFAVRPEEDAEAIDAFLKQLKPVPSPYLVNGKLSESATRGQTVYDDAGCAVCHSGSYYTNLEGYNVGTGLGREEDWKFDTPSLVEVWRTAPFLHDGRSASIAEVLKKHNTEDKHGATSDLSDAQLADLAAYVLSL
ncbi:MAG: c-type cytochrome [bacterium]|nr:c-type cytochrome [bacterium]